MLKNSRNKGITLIALVITIIVLLILAGISISMLSGDNSILKRAIQAKDKTEETTREEQIKISMMEAASNVNGDTYNGVKIPAGFAPTKKEGESSVDEGLVITDSEGNEYVWIEVPNGGTGPIYTAVEEKEKNSSEYYEAISSALRKYCEKDANNGNLIKDGARSDGYSGKTSTYGYKDIWYSECGIESEQEYVKLYNKMLNSVYKNGGFWIGRYEAGIEGSDKNTSLAKQSHTDITDSSPKAVSKPNCVPYNFVNCCDAQKLASKAITNGTNTSSLMFGIQWDLILRYLSAKGIATDLITGENAYTLGNYYDNSFEINRGKYSYQKPYNVYIDYNNPIDNKVTYQNNVSKKVRLTDENSILLTTGASDLNCQKNIYDLAGNIEEFTLEKTTLDFMGMISCVRGGCFCNIFVENGISLRVYYTTTDAAYHTGFRVCIF